jgi:hypothetical protein
MHISGTYCVDFHFNGLVFAFLEENVFDFLFFLPVRSSGLTLDRTRFRGIIAQQIEIKKKNHPHPVYHLLKEIPSYIPSVQNGFFRVRYLPSRTFLSQVQCCSLSSLISDYTVTDTESKFIFFRAADSFIEETSDDILHSVT